eukprot:s261_g9.t1
MSTVAPTLRLQGANVIFFQLAAIARPKAMAARKVSDPKPPSFEEEVNELMQPGIIPKLWGKPSAKVMDDPYSRETVCAEIGRDGRALAHAGPPLKKDKELVLKAVQKDGSALMFASEELQRDKDVVLAAVACDGLVLGLAKDLIGDKEVALVAVAQNGMALRHCAEHLRDDQDVCLAAVQQNGRALRHASEQQQNNKEVVDAALQNCTQALPYAGPELKKEWEEILTGRWKDEGWHLERRQAGQILSQVKT